MNSILALKNAAVAAASVTIRDHDYLPLEPTVDMIVRQVGRILSFGVVLDPGALAHNIEGQRVPWNVGEAVFFTPHGAVFRACSDFGALHLVSAVLATMKGK